MKRRVLALLAVVALAMVGFASPSAPAAPNSKVVVVADGDIDHGDWQWCCG